MQLSLNRFSAPTEPEALRLAMEQQSHALPARMAALLMGAGVLCIWIDWPLALTWAAIVAVFDAVISQRLISPIVIRNIDSNPRFAEWLGALFCLIGSALYASSWVLAVAAGGGDAGLLAGVWVGLGLVHALVYFSNVRLAFFACTIPVTLIALALPFVQGLSPLIATVVVLVVLTVLAMVIVAARDRNQLVVRLAEQRAARVTAEEANTAKSQFLANMSHELRTPLNAVIGYAEILEEDLGEAGRGSNAADANRIRKAARHLLGLINEVLDLSKIEAGRMEVSLVRCDLAQIVADAVEQARPAAEANGNTLVVTMPALDPVVADGGKLGQCLLNFLSNAAKFTENGRIDVRVALADGMLQIDVADTGCGIAPADARRLFQPFTQVDESITRRAGGTGLGLVITRRLAELMGGDVTFVSAPGEGSTFTLRLAVESTPEEAGPTRPCVLVVEDEASARDLTRRALASLPLDLRAVGSVAEGLVALHELNPALVVLDIHLPDGEGWAVLAEVRRSRPTVPVLVVTVDDDRARALTLGAADHLQKPVDREGLLAAALRLTAPTRAAA